MFSAPEETETGEKNQEHDRRAAVRLLLMCTLYMCIYIYMTDNVCPRVGDWEDSMRMESSADDSPMVEADGRPGQYMYTMTIRAH